MAALFGVCTTCAYSPVGLGTTLPQAVDILKEIPATVVLLSQAAIVTHPGLPEACTRLGARVFLYEWAPPTQSLSLQEHPSSARDINNEGVHKNQRVQERPGVPPQRRGDQDVALILLTSGSTSRPKKVLLSHHGLVCGVHHIRDTLCLHSGDCGINLMPLHHLHGIAVSILTSLASSVPVVCPRDTKLQPRSFFQLAKRFNVTWSACHDAM